MLRNGCLEKNKRFFFGYDKVKSTSADNMLSLSRGAGFTNIEGFKDRELFKPYFNHEESVAWQFGE